MNARTSPAAHLVTLAALRADPSSMHVDASTPGLAGVLVLFSPPSTRPTPTTLRTTFADACDRAAPAAGYVIVDGVRTDPLAAHTLQSLAFSKSLPEVISPVAALGLACKDKGARDVDSEWVHNRTVKGSSRWTYCRSVVTDASVNIHGAETAAESSPDGTLVIDADVPGHIASALRVAYDAARGVVEPSRVKALVARYLVEQGARTITDGCFLLPETTPTTCGVLAGLVDLGGWAETVAVADPARIARLASPVSKSIEQQIADVIAETTAFIARAKAIAEPMSTEALRASRDESGAETGESTTGEARRAEIRAAAKAASTWAKRLNLAHLDVTAELGALDDAVKAADAAGLAATKARAEATREAKKAEKGLAANLAALDDEQARDERAEAYASSPATK